MKIIESSKNIVLIVVSHTDDETIGMGGTIARHLRNGDEIFVNIIHEKFLVMPS